jgi:hypothetical protein
LTGYQQKLLTGDIDITITSRRFIKLYMYLTSVMRENRDNRETLTQDLLDDLYKCLFSYTVPKERKSRAHRQDQRRRAILKGKRNVTYLHEPKTFTGTTPVPLPGTFEMGCLG